MIGQFSSDTTPSPLQSGDSPGTPESIAGTAEMSEMPAPVNDGPAQETEEASEGRNILLDHKGKLAMGVAATLGVMIYYNWRQKKLAKEDPEAYASLKKIKKRVLSDGKQGGWQDRRMESESRKQPEQPEKSPQDAADNEDRMH